MCRVFSICMCILLFCVTACSDPQVRKMTEVGYYLDTVITLTAYTNDDRALQEALEECGRYERLLSRTVEDSDVWNINHSNGQPTAVSDDTIRILREAIRIGDLSAGCFDVTIAPVSSLWDFKSGNGAIPAPEMIAEAVRTVDYRKIQIDGNLVTVPDGMMIDLGGIAKGYIADRIRDYLAGRGVQHAILSFGGNVIAIGRKPDGTSWKVGIQDIDDGPGVSMLTTYNNGGSVVTSGIYERGFEKDGIWYHHILSTENGWPVQNTLASVTVFSDSSMTGDALATAVFALGAEKGMELIESMESVEAIMIQRDRSVLISSGADDYLKEED